jgi:hypothetical protein
LEGKTLGLIGGNLGINWREKGINWRKPWETLGLIGGKNLGINWRETLGRPPDST